MLFALLLAFLASAEVIDRTPFFTNRKLGPNAWVQPGGLIVDGQRFDAGVAFSVWAPNADSNTAYVVPHKTSAGWKQTAMTKNTSDGTFYVNVGNAQPGDEYTFQFTYKNGNPFTRLDPRAQAITNTLNKADARVKLEYIHGSVKAHTIIENATAEGEQGWMQSWAASVVHDPNFDWSGSSYISPDYSKLIVYEMHIPSFNPPSSGGIGTFDTAIDKLDWIASLNINAVELLPVSTFSGDTDGWGYNPCAYYATMTEFGGYAGLKRFVKAANQRKIAVILDVVFNHMDDGSNILNTYDGYPGAVGNGIYFYQDSRAYTPWGPRPNYDSSPVNQYLIDNINMWLNEYHISGFRWDSTICIRHGGTPNVACYDDTADIDAGWVLMQNGNDATHVSSYKGWTTAEDTKEYKAITASTSDKSQGLPGAPGGAGFNNQWGEQYYYTLEPILTLADNSQANMNTLSSLLTATDGEDPNRVMYTENHDKASNQQLGRIPAIVDSGGKATAPSYWAFKKSFMGMSIGLTASGVPMLFYGQEFLTYAAFNFPDPPAINWGLATTNQGATLFVSDLAALRINKAGTTPGLTGNQTSILQTLNTGTDKVVVMSRSQIGGGAPTIVVINLLSTQYSAFGLTNVPKDGTWNIRLNSDATRYCSQFGNYGVSQTSISVSGGKGSLMVPAYAIVVLSQ